MASSHAKSQQKSQYSGPNTIGNLHEQSDGESHRDMSEPMNLGQPLIAINEESSKEIPTPAAQHQKRNDVNRSSSRGGVRVTRGKRQND